MPRDLSFEDARDIFDCDPEAGVLYWKKKPSPKSPIIIGAVAGSTSGGKKPYRLLSVRNVKYCEHRVIWTWVNGYPPPEFIDHIDRNHNNNSIRNLRLASSSQNGANRGKTYGRNPFKGVNKCSTTGRWTSKLTFQGRVLHLGSFDDPTDALAAYAAKARELFGEFARAA